MFPLPQTHSLSFSLRAALLGISTNMAYQIIIRLVISPKETFSLLLLFENLIRNILFIFSYHPLIIQLSVLISLETNRQMSNFCCPYTSGVWASTGVWLTYDGSHTWIKLTLHLSQKLTIANRFASNSPPLSRTGFCLAWACVGFVYTVTNTVSS